MHVCILVEPVALIMLITFERGDAQGTFQVCIFKSVQILAWIFFTWKICIIFLYLQRGPRATAQGPPKYAPATNTGDVCITDAVMHMIWGDWKYMSWKMTDKIARLENANKYMQMIWSSLFQPWDLVRRSFSGPANSPPTRPPTCRNAQLHIRSAYYTACCRCAIEINKDSIVRPPCRGVTVWGSEYTDCSYYYQYALCIYDRTTPAGRLSFTFSLHFRLHIRIGRLLFASPNCSSRGKENTPKVSQNWWDELQPYNRLCAQSRPPETNATQAWLEANGVFLCDLYSVSIETRLLLENRFTV